MSTPLQRARTKLRVMYQLQQAAREHQRRSVDGHEAAGSPVANGAEANHAQAQHDEENPLKTLSLPLLPKLPPCRSDTLGTESSEPPRSSLDLQRRSGGPLPGSATEASPEAPGLLSFSTDVSAIWGLLVSSYMNLLLVAVPLGFAAQLLGWSAGLRFSLVRDIRILSVNCHPKGEWSWNSTRMAASPPRNMSSTKLCTTCSCSACRCSVRRGREPEQSGRGSQNNCCVPTRCSHIEKPSIVLLALAPAPLGQIMA